MRSLLHAEGLLRYAGKLSIYDDNLHRKEFATAVDKIRNLKQISND
jgi:hypothetical protein